MTYSRTSFNQATELAQLAKPWDTAPAEHVAALLSKAHCQALIAESFKSDNIFLIIDAFADLQPAAKVSLVKSAPATYCTGYKKRAPWHRFYRNDLNELARALTV